LDLNQWLRTIKQINSLQLSNYFPSLDLNPKAVEHNWIRDLLSMWTGLIMSYNMEFL
jgi:hypothetical protein